MGNQLVKKSQTDCQILIFGEKSSGKSLFQQLISKHLKAAQQSKHVPGEDHMFPIKFLFQPKTFLL
jgi:tRNA A37 threonylcarbamoyladenosine biosynthesis protein TsaE